MFILGMVAMTSVYAANTEVARITLTAQGGTESSYVTLRLDPTVTEVSTTSYFENTDLVGNVNIYAIYNSTYYTAYKYNNLTNFPIGFVTNRREASYQTYTMTFNVPTSTNGLTLVDLAVDPTGANPINITNGDTYEFQVNTTLHSDYVAETNYRINDRFVINYDPTVPVASVTTNEEGWATFAYSQNVVPQTPAALTVYAGAINGEELTLTAVDYVKAGEGVVVKGVANATYNFLLGSGSSDFSANDLIGCPAAATVLAGTNFVLSYQNSHTAFYQYTGTTIPAGKAYLNFPAASPAPKRIRMVVGGEQGVENVEAAVKSEKLIRDGQIVIIRNGVEYNAAGQIVK